MTYFFSSLALVDYIAIVILVLSVIVFFLDINKNKEYKYKSSLEELGISRDRTLSFTFRQRLAGYFAILAVIILTTKQYANDIVLVVILSVVVEVIIRKFLKNESSGI